MMILFEKKYFGTHKWKIVEISMVELSKSRNQKSKNRENWQYFKFGSRGRSAFKNGAKHI